MLKKIFAVSIALTILTSTTVSCPHKESSFNPPLLPASYYQCTEITTHDLTWAYFWPMAESMRQQGITPGLELIGKVYLFKNFPVTESLLKDADKGFIWVDTIKCPLLNLDDLELFKVGDRIDVVGINLGPNPEFPGYSNPGLLFKDCIVLPTGAVKLPGDGSGDFRPGY
jgi:hypothetical protein